jgi:predicted metalloprotease with PDZ domain
MLLAGFLSAQGTWAVLADEEKPIFENDCISFAGRGLANAPVKKKIYPGMTADGTAWTFDADSKKVVVTKLFAGEAAEKGGVEVGDQVVSVNGYNTDGQRLRQICFAYHMYEPDTLIETLVVQKKDGTQKSVRLQLLTLDKCAPEEKTAWLQQYKSWGY